MLHDYSSFRTSMFVDRYGNPVEKDRYTYPYSYDPYVVYKKDDRIKESVKGCVYSDRLFQWDSSKFNSLSRKYFNNERQMDWSERNPKDIEKFLIEYHELENLELIGILNGCNVSNGYPYWVFLFNY